MKFISDHLELVDTSKCDKIFSRTELEILIPKLQCYYVIVDNDGVSSCDKNHVLYLLCTGNYNLTDSEIVLLSEHGVLPDEYAEEYRIACVTEKSIADKSIGDKSIGSKSAIGGVQYSGFKT